MKALVASQNHVKANAASDALLTFTSELISVELADFEISSGVSDQPLSLQETAMGALNRLKAIQHIGGYAYYIAIEGGVYSLDINGSEKWFESACAAVSSPDMPEPSIAFGPAYPVPDQFVRHLLDGQDLNQAIERETGIKDIGAYGGFNGWLTKEQLDRRNGSSQAVLLALHGLNKNTQEKP